MAGANARGVERAGLAEKASEPAHDGQPVLPVIGRRDM